MTVSLRPSCPPAISVYWLDYLAATAPALQIPFAYSFNLLPSRFSQSGYIFRIKIGGSFFRNVPPSIQVRKEDHEIDLRILDDLLT
jgi:hypothetical protein